MDSKPITVGTPSDLEDLIAGLLDNGNDESVKLGTILAGFGIMFEEVRAELKQVERRHTMMMMATHIYTHYATNGRPVLTEEQAAQKAVWLTRAVETALEATSDRE